MSKLKVRQWTGKLLILDFIFTYLIMQSVIMRPAETINCSQPSTESLLNALRESYFNKTEVRPVLHLTTPTMISVGFAMYAILDVNEKAQILDTFLYVWFSWNIEGLSWDPDECGTDRITLPRKKFWRPDIIINELISDNQAPSSYYVSLDNTGVIEDGLPYHVVSSCNLDIYSFPFDVQNCIYTFGSYKHTMRDIQLSFSEPVEETLRKSLHYMETRGEWELITMLASKPNNSIYFNFDGMDPWDELKYNIVLKRRPTLYVVNLLLPSYFLITVDLFSFLLPPQAVDRSAFKMTLILGYTVFLLLMNDLLPVTGNTIPLINVFFSLCLALMVASLLETILITNIMCASSNYTPLPKWVKVLFLHYLARLVCMGKNTSDQNSAIQRNNITSCSPEEEMTEIKHQEKGTKSLLNFSEQEVKELSMITEHLLIIRQQVDKHFSNDRKTEEWMRLGEVIDRFIFILYVVFLSVSLCTILVFWLYWYSFQREA
ncbi:5-hydroxytryptamine receptor 3E-like [Myxocyprinus asiaticus]|uniref:5-hydroxytryptamine receptor 3E-like n=1 Tax=Myxocyprinus asiaticus TaxID=70543 RepID=UPI002222C3D5|nr:5-hydroxytryptamine receptor 3E-like [Myxocyprinus asiaticus]